MKTFIDPQEHFFIDIPNEWFFTTAQHNDDVNQQPYGFEPYDERNAAFQISYKKITSTTIKVSIPEQPKGVNNLQFISSDQEGIKTWLTKIEGGYIVIISYVYEDSVDSKQKELDLSQAENSVKSLLILNEESIQRFVPRIRWNNFMLSSVAATDLTSRAYDNFSHVELVIILANKIDASIRQSIILTRQLNDKSDEFDVSLIYQKETDRPIMEKAIYKMALDEGIITQDYFDVITDLYNLRNKVVHRYIISDLRSVDIIKLARSYTEVFDDLNNQVISLEQRQFEEQVGLYKGDVKPGSETTESFTKNIISSVRDKHGSRKMNEGLSIGK